MAAASMSQRRTLSRARVSTRCEIWEILFLSSFSTYIQSLDTILVIDGAFSPCLDQGDGSLSKALLPCTVARLETNRRDSSTQIPQKYNGFARLVNIVSSTCLPRIRSRRLCLPVSISTGILLGSALHPRIRVETVLRSVSPLRVDTYHRTLS